MFYSFIKTDYSLFSSALTLKKMVKETKSDILILSDDHMFGVLEFVYACREVGKRPIIGLHKRFDNASFIFVAKSYKGYKDLLKAESFNEFTSLYENEDVLVILESEFADADIPNVDIIINSMDKCFNPKKRDNSIYINTAIINGLEEKDFYSLASIKAVGDNISIADSALQATFNYNGISDAYSEIFEEIQDYFEFGDPKPPQFKFRQKYANEYNITAEDDFTLFKFLCEEGLKNRFKGQKVPKEYTDRLSYEIDIIKGMKFPGYMLIVWDFVNKAKEMGIPVGPGRGSAAGSLVAYALQITNIDPIPYKLLFERFLNPERVSFPDIDMDFCRDRREEVIQYVTEAYGSEYVAQVITFGKIAAKSAIRDAARIQRLPLFLADKMAKLIPEKPGFNLEEAIKGNTELQEKISEFEGGLIWKKANQIEGMTRNLGVHAAGLIIGSEKIVDKSPLYEVNGTHVVQYDGKYLEDVDLVKFDFLGLKTLTMIDYALKMIKKNHNKDIDINTISLSDKMVFDTISTGSTTGMFQIESDGMKSLNKRLKPDRFEDLIAVLALYRPGPMESGMLESFVKRKRGEEEISYFYKEMEPVLKPILEPTYGVIVYQEQVMQIVQAIGGFSLGYADIIRRAMGKKKDMSQYNEEFSLGAEKLGFSKKNASELFKLIEKFAGYGFNKSHSAAYAMITYQTAWLKTHYPEEFIAALLNSEIGNLDKVSNYIAEAKAMGIKVHAPSIKTSSIMFEVRDGEIFYGLKAVKGVGDDVINFISSAKNSNYNLKDCIYRANYNPEKDLLAINKKIVALNKKKTSLNKKLNDVSQKIQNLSSLENLTDFKKNQLIKNKEKSKGFVQDIESISAEIQMFNEQKIKVENILENGNSYNPINKRVFEALANVGALSSFGYTRKCLAENTEAILKGNFDFSKCSKDEYSVTEIMELEEKYMEYVFCLPFVENDLFVDTESEKVIVVTGTSKRYTKAGKPYNVVHVMDRMSQKFLLSDFNDRFSKFKIGDILEIELSLGKYINLKNVKKHIATTSKGLLKLSILDTIPEDVSLYEQINVYDGDALVLSLK